MKFLFSLIAFAFSVSTHAQNENPVDWSFSAKKINATTYEIHMTASIEKDWHIYSQTTPDGGPVATAITFNKNPLVKFSGKVKEVGKLEQHYEELFEVQVKQFSSQVDFVQTVTVKPGIKTVIAGSVEYMACTERNCLPPRTQKFSLPISK